MADNTAEFFGQNDIEVDKSDNTDDFFDYTGGIVEETVEITDFDTLIKDYSESGDIVLQQNVPVLEQLKETLNSKNIVGVSILLGKLSKAENYAAINYYIGELKEISDKYKGEKESVKTETGGRMKDTADSVNSEIEAERIEDPTEFIRSLLEANETRLNGRIKSVEATIDEAVDLSADELVSRMSGDWFKKLGVTWNFFDVREDEWQKYFEEHNIPEEKQNQLKKFYSKLMKNKDFGNLLVPDFGDKIGREAQRINALPDDDNKITINIGALNLSGIPLEFETKQEALLYLYYNKVLLREVATALGDIIVTGEFLGTVLGDGLGIIFDNLEVFISVLLGYMGINTAGTVLRKINAFMVMNRYNQGFVPTVLTGGLNKLSVGEFLLKSATPLDGEESREAAELAEREKYIDMLEEKYKGNPEKLQQIKKAKRYIRVLDHNIDSSEEDQQRLTNIEEKISERKEKLEGLDKSQKAARTRLKKELARFQEQRSDYVRKFYRFGESTFWREITYIEGGKNKYLDTFLKPWLSSTESESIDKLKVSKKLFVEASKELFDEKGNVIGVLAQVEDYLKRSHEVSNDMEQKVEEKFNDFVKKLKNGQFGDAEGLDKKGLIENIKLELLNEINGIPGLKLNSDVFSKDHKLDNALALFFDGFDAFPTPTGTNKRQEWVKLLFQDMRISDSQLREVDKFFAEIHKKGGNEYNQRTAMDIVARIIKLDISYKDAINESFSRSWEDIKKINIDSDFQGSLDNLLGQIDEGKYQLTDDDKVSADTRSTKETNIIEGTLVDDKDLEVRSTAAPEEDITKTEGKSPEVLRDQLEVKNEAFAKLSELAPLMDKILGSGEFDIATHGRDIMETDSIDDIDKYVSEILSTYNYDGQPLTAKTLRNTFIMKSRLGDKNKQKVLSELETKSMSDLDTEFQSQKWFTSIPEFLDKLARAV